MGVAAVMPHKQKSNENQDNLDRMDWSKWDMDSVAKTQADIARHVRRTGSRADGSALAGPFPLGVQSDIESDHGGFQGGATGL